MAMQKSKIEMKRINMNIPLALYEKVSDYADNLGINVTSAFIVLLNQSLNNNSMIELMPVMFSVINDIKTGAISQDTFDNLQLLNEKGLDSNINTEDIL